MVIEMTGQGRMASWIILAATLPFPLVTPVAGVIADRWDRRKIMIAADLIRAVLTLGFLLVAPSGQVWLVFPILIAIVVVSAFFGPAASAALPNLVTSEQIVAANALNGASWGTMLAVGATIGGFVSHYVGRDASFILDSASYVVSALLIASVRVPFASPREKHETHESSHPGQDFLDSLRYAARHRGVLGAVLIKTVWGMGGGVISLLSVLPLQVFHAGDRGIALLYASRGVGALLGPFIANRFAGGRPRSMAMLAAVGVIVSGVFYAAFAASPTLAIAALCVFIAHLGGGAQWVLSSSLLQRTVNDRILGRISALDMGGITAAMAASTILVGAGIDPLGPRVVGVMAGCLTMALGAVWMVVFGLLLRDPFERVEDS